MDGSAGGETISEITEPTASIAHDGVVRALTQSGALFEMVTGEQDGRTIRIWKNGPQTLQHIFAMTQSFESLEFVVLDDRHVTYGSFRKATLKLAAWLQAKGIGQGDVVGIMMANRPEWLVTYFAIALTGATSALINPAATSTELAHALAISEPRVLVSGAEVVSRILAIEGERCPGHIVVVDGSRDRMLPASTDLHAWDDVVGSVENWPSIEAQPFTPVPIQPADAASILFTAGTTGQAKGVVLTHRGCAYSVFHAAFRNARQVALTKATLSPEGQHSVLMVLPLFHTSGICNAVLPMMARGARIILTNFWSPKLAAKIMHREKTSFFGSVPIAVEQLMTAFAGEGPPASLRQVICGGGPPTPLMAGRIAAAGLIPGQHWGMTETSGGVIGIIGPEFLERPTSCGLPAPVHDMRVVSGAGAEVAPGEVGELQVRGPQVMKGYYRDRAATAAAFDGDWLKTGDLARIDADGYCYVVDRAKDMLICAGENVYCIEIENAISANSAVAEVAVVGLPDPVMGEAPAAVVRLHEGSKISGEDLRADAAKRLQLFKTPTRILIADEPLPRNRMGKVVKSELRGWFDA